jgi:hypothetical protein
VNPVGQVDEESRNGEDWMEDSVDDKNDSSYQGASTLSLNVVKDEVVDVPGISSIKPTTIDGIYHPQLSSSPPPAPLSTLLVARIQPSTSASYPIATCGSKQEPIEQTMHIIVTVQPRMMDNTHYAATNIYSGSILPINPDLHNFQSYSPPRPCQEIS